VKTNQIICGDCVDVMAGFEDNVIDMACTSPPYDALRDYKGYTFDFKAIAHALYRVTKPGGIVVWVVGDETVKGGKTGTSFRHALGFMDVGFKLFDTILYHKTGTSFPSKSRYTNCYEYMFVFSKNKPKTVNAIKDVPKRWEGSFGVTTQRQKDGSLKASSAKNCGLGKSGPAVGDEYGYKVRSNIWTYKNGYGHAHPDKDLTKAHPAVYPLALACDHIVSWSNPGDLVLDPMAGSGTTCKAAHGLNRDYLGIDVSSEYIKLGEQRVALVKRGEYLNDEEKTGYKIL